MRGISVFNTFFILSLSACTRKQIWKFRLELTFYVSFGLTLRSLMIVLLNQNLQNLFSKLLPLIIKDLSDTPFLLLHYLQTVSYLSDKNSIRYQLNFLKDLQLRLSKSNFHNPPGISKLCYWKPLQRTLAAKFAESTFLLDHPNERILIFLLINT